MEYECEDSYWTYLKKMQKIDEGLYLSGYAAAENLDWLKENKITHILTVADQIEPPHPEVFNISFCFTY
jgi:hypothetical protein